MDLFQVQFGNNLDTAHAYHWGLFLWVQVLEAVFIKIALFSSTGEDSS